MKFQLRGTIVICQHIMLHDFEYVLFAFGIFWSSLFLEQSDCSWYNVLTCSRNSSHKKPFAHWRSIYLRSKYILFDCIGKKIKIIFWWMRHASNFDNINWPETLDFLLDAFQWWHENSLTGILPGSGGTPYGSHYIRVAVSVGAQHVALLYFQAGNEPTRAH